MEKQYLLVYLLFFSILLTSYQVHGIFSSLGLYNPLRCFSNNITYSDFKVDFYFSSKNQYHHKLTDEDIFYGNFDFNPRRRTVVVIHGLIPQVYENKIEHLTDSFLQWGDINLIYVDWKKGCTNAITYVKAVVNTEKAAIKVSELFGNLIKAWHGTERSVENWSYLHIIGHSLGAHVAGQSAARLREEHYLLVDRVTGLDPAGPCFHTDDHMHLHLKHSDARFVDTIRTDGGLQSHSRFGQLEPIGHIDFYVNGGTVQPGCRALRLKRETINLPRLGFQIVNENGICQHLRAYDIFADSLKQVGKRECIFWAHPWSNIQTSQPPTGLKWCNQETCIEMGINAEYYQNRRGAYYAPTSGASPFCNY